MQHHKHSCTVPSKGSKTESQIIKLSGIQGSVHRGISILFVLSHDTISQPRSRFIVSMFGMQEHRMQFIWELPSQDMPSKIYHSISQLLPQHPNSLAIKTVLTVKIKTEVVSEKLIPVILTNRSSAKELLLCSLCLSTSGRGLCLQELLPPHT